MARWSIVIISVLVLLGMGCGGGQSSEPRSDAQSTSSTTADTTAPDTTAMTASTSPSDDGEASSEPDNGNDAAAPDEETAASDRTLTTAQKNRIGGRLQRLIRGEEGGPQPVGSRGGASVYEVTIKTDNPDALRKAGIPLGTVQGSVATARLTIDQILTAATIDGVGGIQAAIQQQTHEENREGDIKVQPMDGNDSSG